MEQSKNSLGKLYMGTSGLILPVPNKAFYPDEFKERSRLCYYSSLMNSIEVNSSFYKTPMGNTVAKWVNEVNDDFKFTFKLLRDITHNKGLIFDPVLLQKFMHSISFAKEKQGILLIQFPPSLKVESSLQVERLLTFVREYDPVGWKVAVEFRHPSWYKTETYDLLNDRNISLVIHDKAPAHTPMIELDASFVYLRFHGPNGNYRGSYDDGFLAEYASYISDWLNDGKEVYVYFNNTMGEAYQNLSTLRDFVSESVFDAER
ncbi:DUF72 domain-containing protein [Pedobacter paludis]|uniref:DUF72 domain-containing protein n=1 Tax=Pedobacter paludis TaxID=2203212 RepID=A0A317F397_9SPHI|nr:DUF72 domain-containing protein [Pedobacter paludis]PWS31968.1 DUF72 domain-containing protein [Pedobacter paludis]